MAITYNN